MATEEEQTRLRTQAQDVTDVCMLEADVGMELGVWKVLGEQHV